MHERSPLGVHETVTLAHRVTNRPCCGIGFSQRPWSTPSSSPGTTAIVHVGPSTNVLQLVLPPGSLKSCTSLHLFSILGFMLAAAKCDASFGYATFHRPNVALETR